MCGGQGAHWEISALIPQFFFFSFKQDSTSFIYIFMTYIYGLIQLTKSNNNDKDGT